MTLLALLVPGLAGLGLWYWTGSARVASTAALVALVLVLIAGLWHRGRQLDAAQRDAHAAGLVRDSLEAVADTLRIHVLDVDSARTVAERRATQVEVERDAVDELLRTERRARARAELRVAQLETEVSTPVSIDTLRPDVRLVDTRIRQEPFTVRIRGEVPPAPLDARFRVSVALDPAPIAVGVHCGPAGESGIRPARVSITTPAWLQVVELEPEVDPGTCNPVIPPPGMLERIRIGAPYAAAGLIVGGVLVLVFAK